MISAVIYTTNEIQPENPIIEIKNNNLTLFNIDAHFSKENRLKTMSKWDDQKWTDLVGGTKVDWSIVIGMPYQGRSTLANIISKNLGYKLIDWKAVEAQVKKSLGTEEEPFEGKVPLAKVEEAVIRLIEKDKRSGQKSQYIFDSFPLHATAADFYKFTSEQLKCASPDYLFDLRESGVTLEVALARLKKSLEAEELNEEQKEGLNKEWAASATKASEYAELLESQIESGRVKHINTLKTDAASEEYQVTILKSLLKPRVILVNHEKRLSVDTTCANMGIKFNMLYISVYQVIKQHIEGNTAFGKRLLATKKPKEIMLQSQTKDEFGEAEYSAVHFDLDLIMELLAHHISVHRTPGQRYIMIEGLCNASRLLHTDDKMELRLMDEIFAIERNIGEV